MYKHKHWAIVSCPLHSAPVSDEPARVVSAQWKDLREMPLPKIGRAWMTEDGNWHGENPPKPVKLVLLGLNGGAFEHMTLRDWLFSRLGSQAQSTAGLAKRIAWPASQTGALLRRAVGTGLIARPERGRYQFKVPAEVPAELLVA